MTVPGGGVVVRHVIYYVCAAEDAHKKTLLSSRHVKKICHDWHYRTRIYVSLVLSDFAKVITFLGFSLLNYWWEGEAEIIF